MPTESQAELITTDARQLPAAPLASPIAILEKAIAGGITQENVSVVKELIAMCREQRAEDAKTAFARAFFQLKKNMPEIYADKEAKNGTKSMYTYCSEKEISEKLEPHLMSYGFTMLFGQSESENRITVSVTLMHEAGHQEERTYMVRPGATNSMKDATAADTGAATTAWRHLMIKLFGLKSRIQENQDARNEGEPISFEQVETLRELVKETKSDEAAFLRFAGAETYETIGTARYQQLFNALQKKLGH